MPIIAWIVIAALAAGLGGGIVHTYNSALNDKAAAIVDAKTEHDNNRTLTMTLQDQRVENATLKAKQEILDDITTKRKTANVTIAQINGAIDAKLQGLVSTNADVRAWAIGRVPAAVLDSVRQPAAGIIDRPGSGEAGTGTAAGAVHGANPGAGVAARGDVKHGVIQLRPAKPNAPASLQR